MAEDLSHQMVSKKYLMDSDGSKDNTFINGNFTSYEPKKTLYSNFHHLK